MNVISSNEYKQLIERFTAFTESKHPINEDGISVLIFSNEGKSRLLVVMRNEEEVILRLFTKANDFYDVGELLDDDEGKADAMFRANLIQVDMHPVEDMFDEEYDAYERAGIDLSDEVPYFRNFLEGHSVWVIDAWDARILHTAFDLIEHVQTLGDFPSYAFYDQLNEDWKELLFYEAEEINSVAIDVSLTLEKLTFRKRGQWLIGCYYLPFPNQLGDNSRPMHPYVCFVVDEETEEVIQIIEPEEGKSPNISFNEQLYQYMKDHKMRPRRVCFFDEIDEDKFTLLFRHLDVEMGESSEMELLNFAWLDLQEDFLSNLELAMDDYDETKTLH